MAFTIPEALKRVQNKMTAGILKSIATTDELGALISIEAVDGTALKLDREGTLPSTTFIPDTGVATEESSGADDVPEVQFRRIVGSLDIDNLAGAGNDAGTKNRLIGKKAKTTWRLMKDKLINGGRVTGFSIQTSEINTAVTAMDYSAHLDSTRRGPGTIKYVNTGKLWSFRAPGDITFGTPVAAAADGDFTLTSHNPSNFITATIDVSAATANAEESVYFTSSNNEFDGLWEMCDPSMVTATAANGTAFAISMFDDLIDTQKIREQRAFICNGKVVNRYFAAMRSLGGTDPATISIPGYNGVVPTYRGIPVLTDDNIANYTQGTGTVSDIALVSLSPSEGLVIAAQTAGGGAGAFTPDADPRTRSVLGFRIEDVGILEGKDAVRTRVKWYGAPVLKSTLACAVIQGVIETP